MPSFLFLLGILLSGALAKNGPSHDHRPRANQAYQVCTHSHIGAFEVVTEPIGFSTDPLCPAAAPKLSAVNTTSWEQWYFEGVSSNGTSAIAIAFARDSSYTILGQGILRVEVDFTWDDGSSFRTVHWLDESVVDVCDDTIRGIWSDVDGEFIFEVATDTRWARISMDRPYAQGSFLITNFNAVRTPDGRTYPDPDANTEMSPYLHVQEAIPAGYMDADFTVQGRKFAMTGIGGHVRIWASESWFVLVDNWQVVRSVVGPYTLTYWIFTSRIDNVVYVSAFLAKQGRKIFSSRLAGPSDSGLDDYATFEYTYEGTLSGGLRNKATGYLIELVSPAQDRRWRFELEHRNIFLEMGLYYNGDGMTGLVQTASGGEIVNGSVGDNGYVHRGMGISEQVQLHPSYYGDAAVAGGFARHITPYVPTAVFSSVKKITKQFLYV